MSYSSEIVSTRNCSPFKRRVLVSAIAIAISSFAGLVQAAPDIEQAPRLSGEDYGRESFPNEYAIAVPVGEASLYPSGTALVSSVDNIFHQEDGSEGDVTVTRTQIIPKLDLVAEGGKSVFWGVLRGDLRSHSGDNNADNADSSDFRLRGFGHFDFDNRNRLDLELSSSRLSEELGTGRTRGDIDFNLDTFEDPDTYTLNRIGVTYSYGNPRSRGELVAGIAGGTLEYVENTAELSEFDRDMSLLWGRFSYKLTGKTTLSSRLTFRRSEFTDDNNAGTARRDRDETTLRLGANWNATGLLYGDAYVAFSDREYTEREGSDSITDSSDTILGANITWAIKSYSTANFYVQQFVDDDISGASENTEEISTVGVRWRHGWTDRFNTTAAVYSSEEESDGETTSEREVVSLEGRLLVRRWLNLLVGASNDQLDSDGIDSTRNRIYVGLEGNL